MPVPEDKYYPLKNRLIALPPRVGWNGTCGNNYDGYCEVYMNLQPPLYKKFDRDNHYA